MSLSSLISLFYQPDNKYYYKENNGKVSKLKEKNKTLHRIDGPALISYEEYGPSLLQEHYYQNNYPHRDNGPAYIFYRKTDKKEIYKQEHYQKGLLHNDNGPAIIKNHYSDSTKVAEEIYYLNGEIHRENAPAKILYNDTGNLAREIYYKNGKVHRDNGPAVIEYDNYGNISKEKYLLNDLSQRDNDPAIISYYNGRVKEEIWEQNNRLCNDKGPVQKFYKDGKLEREIYSVKIDPSFVASPKAKSFLKDIKDKVSSDSFIIVSYHESGKENEVAYLGQLTKDRDFNLDVLKINDWKSNSLFPYSIDYDDVSFFEANGLDVIVRSSFGDREINPRIEYRDKVDSFYLYPSDDDKNEKPAVDGDLEWKLSFD